MPKSLGIYSRSPVSLPNPPFPKATLRVVEAAITAAWRIIRDDPQGDFDLETASEDRITLELRNCLMDRVLDGGLVDGFTSDRFSVNRESKFESYDGTYLDKMPDLHIAVIRNVTPGLRSADGIFVECKPVDVDHPAGGDYCDKGISRFVEGQYAWAMTVAVMIGYARAGYVVPKKLQEAIAVRKKQLKTDGVVTACKEGAPSGYSQHPHITIHRRGFLYKRVDGKAPNITLRHLWFNRE